MKIPKVSFVTVDGPIVRTTRLYRRVANKAKTAIDGAAARFMTRADRIAHPAVAVVVPAPAESEHNVSVAKLQEQMAWVVAQHTALAAKAVTQDAFEIARREHAAAIAGLRADISRTDELCASAVDGLIGKMAELRAVVEKAPKTTALAAQLAQLQGAMASKAELVLEHEQKIAELQKQLVIEMP
jgi:hypothetical protein